MPISTPIHDSVAGNLYTEIPRSQLLEESPPREAPFSSVYDLTWSHDASAKVDFYLVGQTISASLTPILNEELSRFRARHSRIAPQEEHDPIYRTNNDRVTLLARKYVAHERFSEEEHARLAILTERLRQLVPAVTKSELENIDGMLRLIEEAEQTDSEIRALIGFDAKDA